MPIFYKNNNEAWEPEEHDVRPEGYADAPNGWVDNDYVAPVVKEAVKKVVKKKTKKAE